MKCGLLILLFVLLTGILSCGEQGETNVPLKESANESIHVSNMPEVRDTVTVKLLIKKGNLLLNSDPDSALVLFRQAHILSQQIRYNKGIAISLLNTGSLLFNKKKEYSKSREYFIQAESYCRLAKKEDASLMPRLYDCLANVYLIQGRYDSAVHFYYQSLDAIYKMKNTDTQLLLHAYSNIGSALGSVGQYERSLYYLQMAKAGFSLKKDTIELAMICSNIGSAYGRQGDRKAAIQAFNEVLILRKKGSFPEEVQNIYNYMATIWLQNKDVPKAKLYLDSAFASAPSGAQNNLNLQQNLGCVYYFNGDFRKAIPYYKRSLELSKDFGHQASNLNVYATLAALYDTLGMGHIAYQYQTAYSNLKDSLLNTDKLKIVNQLEVKYRTSEKDRELVQKQLMITKQESKIRQQYLWIGVAVLSLLVVFGLMHRRKHKAIIAELKASLAGEEKERLRMASELHDGIVSKLSSVKMNFDVLSRAHAGDLEEAEEFKDVLFQLEQSIIELRTTAQNLQPGILQRAGLAEAIEIYCQKINKVTTLDIHVQFLGELPALTEEFQLNVYRIIQELVQNILKHAEATQALVQLQIRQELLSITVEDNGTGMSAAKLDRKNGIGLTNLQNRVQLLNGTLAISNNKGTSVYIEFHLKHFIIR